MFKPLGDEPVLRHRDVVQPVVRKARAQAVARLAGAAEADDVGDDEEMLRGIERLAGAEQFVGERGLEPGLRRCRWCCGSAARVDDAARGVGLRRAERDVMLPQLRQRLAARRNGNRWTMKSSSRRLGQFVSVMQRAYPNDAVLKWSACRHDQRTETIAARRPPASSLRALPLPAAGDPKMKENFRQFLDRLRQAGELVDLHQAVDIRHIATLVDQAKTALYFHNVIGYDMPVVSGIIRSQRARHHGDGLRDLRRDRAQARARRSPSRSRRNTSTARRPARW